MTRRPTSFFVDHRGGVRTGRLLALAALAALAGVAFAGPDERPSAEHQEREHTRVHATIGR